MPRLVAASTSTLSIPVPARPITLRRSARSIRSGVSFVAERTRIPSNSPIRFSNSSPSQSTPTSTSKRSRRSSTPASAIFSLTRTLAFSFIPVSAVPRRPVPGAPAWEDALGGARGARLDLGAEVTEGGLQRGQGDHDVEGAVVAAVGDPDDLPLQLSLAAGRGDP
jgi:hypothetical protein